MQDKGKRTDVILDNDTIPVWNDKADLLNALNEAKLKNVAVEIEWAKKKDSDFRYIIRVGDVGGETGRRGGGGGYRKSPEEIEIDRQRLEMQRRDRPSIENQKMLDVAERLAEFCATGDDSLKSAKDRANWCALAVKTFVAEWKKNVFERAE
ncbi:MAG: hypothetical protein FJY85_04440 [Deltaproteobacteria bacterium]|nr:hypothetical protein [Deltaproteobacteria bacterium]